MIFFLGKPAGQGHRHFEMVGLLLLTYPVTSGPLSSAKTDMTCDKQLITMLSCFIQ